MRRTAPPIAANSSAPNASWRLEALHDRPGFLIRRLHQLHVALFLEECAGEDITPVQYSILTALDQMGPVEQAALSRAVGLDRTNIADVVARLEQRRLLRRKVSASDRRMKVSALTAEGRALLERVEQAAARAHERTIEALPPAERRRFLKALQRLIDAQPLDAATGSS